MGLHESFKALSDPTRREIIELLKMRRMNAGEIGAHFQMTGATVSHHLNVLKNADLISDCKSGKYIYYELNMTVLEEMLSWFLTLQGKTEDATGSSKEDAIVG